MTKEQFRPLPSLAFYEVWSAAMRIRGLPVGVFGHKIGKTYQQLRMAATGATNGPEAEKVRVLMVAEVGQDLFESLYTEHLRSKGYAA